MTTWVALLRAVNLGPTNKLAMADLRAMLEALGYEDVRTLLQSGNAVFTAGKTAAAVEREVGDALRAHGLGPSVCAMVRSAAYLKKVAAGNPFAHHDPKQLHVVFLASRTKPIDTAKYAPDELAFGDRCVYVRLPNGVQGAKIPDWNKALGVPATMRTWRTVTRLLDLAVSKIPGG